MNNFIFNKKFKGANKNMVLIKNKEYSEEYVEKAIIFYEALLTGEIKKQLKEGLKDEL